jgi:hypothetical protein
MRRFASGRTSALGFGDRHVADNLEHAGMVVPAVVNVVTK